MGLTVNSKDSNPVGYDIEYLNIEGKYGTVDIAGMFEQLEIVEDIQAMCITGEVTLTDGLNLISNLPIVEGDLISGCFKCLSTDPWQPGMDPDAGIDFKYEIVKILDRSRVKQDIQAIRLQFVSVGWTDNMAARVSKAYCQMAYTDAVEGIYDEWLTLGGLQGTLPSKPLEIETSDEVFNYVIPNWHPYEAINWLLSRSWLGPAANYLYYEDKEKINCLTMNTVVAKGPVLTYYTATQNRMLDESGTEIDPDLIPQRYHNLWDFHITDTQDITSDDFNGVFSRRLITHDIVKKKVVDYYIEGPVAPNYILDTPRSYMDDYGELEHINPADPIVLPEVADKMGKAPGNSKLAVYPIHFEQWPAMPEFMPEKWLRQHRAQIAQLDVVKAECGSSGNFTLKAGDKITVELISPQWKVKNGNQDEPELDKRFNGDWLISSIKRVFTQKRHTIMLKLVQDNRIIAPDHIWAPVPEEFGKNP